MKLGEELKDKEGTEEVELPGRDGATGATKEDSCLNLLGCDVRLRDTAGGGGRDRRLRDGDRAGMEFWKMEVSVACKET